MREGCEEFSFSSIAEAVAFEGMLINNGIEYFKREEGHLVYRAGRIIFYVKKENCAKVKQLLGDFKNT